MRKWKIRPGYGITSSPRDNVWLDVQNMVPVSQGRYRTAPTFAQYKTSGAFPASPGATVWGTAILRTAAGTVVAYVATDTKVFSSPDLLTWTDRSPAAWGPGSVRANFAQFGNISLVANDNLQICARDATTANAFAVIAAAPTAKIIVVQSNAVVAFNLSTGGNRFAASDVGDQTNWTTGDSVTATAINHRPGDFKAAVAFRDEIIAFKQSSVYRFTYVGQPVVWRVELLADSIGASGMNSVCVCDDILVFCGDHGATAFDGASFRPLSTDLDPTIGGSFGFSGMTAQAAMQWFPMEKSVAIYTTGIGGDAQAFLVYNFITGAWGQFAPYYNGATAINSNSSMFHTDPATLYSLNSSYPGLFTGGILLVDVGLNPSVMKSQLAWTASKVASLTSGYIGSDVGLNTVRRVNPVLSYAGTTAPAVGGLSLSGYSYDTPLTARASGTALATVTSSNNQRRFDFTSSARWFSFTLNVNDGGACEVEDLLLDSVSGGKD